MLESNVLYTSKRCYVGVFGERIIEILINWDLLILCFAWFALWRFFFFPFRQLTIGIHTLFFSYFFEKNYKKKKLIFYSEVWKLTIFSILFFLLELKSTTPSKLWNQILHGGRLLAVDGLMSQEATTSFFTFGRFKYNGDTLTAQFHRKPNLIVCLGNQWLRLFLNFWPLINNSFR